ncbi:MAG: hypothetical protein Q7S16_04860 [bacterium]|nr:hypothetical protein [bacterium]
MPYLKKPQEILAEKCIPNPVGTTHYGGYFYERDDFWWYASGVPVEAELKQALERKWKDEGGVPPDVL